MAADRLEVRLDPERQRRLKVMSKERGTPASELVRQMIDRAYEDTIRERRHEAARRLAGMEIEEVPDPEELKRQLLSTYDLPDIR